MISLLLFSSFSCLSCCLNYLRQFSYIFKGRFLFIAALLQTVVLALMHVFPLQLTCAEGTLHLISTVSVIKAFDGLYFQNSFNQKIRKETKSMKTS